MSDPGPFVAPVPYTFAFQPIVDAATGVTHAYEALIRGREREPAPHVLKQVPREELHRFDADARLTALSLAGRLNLPCRLSLNCLPFSLRARTIEDVIEAARRAGVSPHQMILEITEEEAIVDQAKFEEAIEAYRAKGISVAIDDFGAGYSGLNLLADFQPDIVKLDMKLVRNVQGHGPRQAIVRAILQACTDLGIEVIAEGIESPEEYRWLRRVGVSLFQGYLFAKPGFEELPRVSFTSW